MNAVTSASRRIALAQSEVSFSRHRVHRGWGGCKAARRAYARVARKAAKALIATFTFSPSE